MQFSTMMKWASVSIQTSVLYGEDLVSAFVVGVCDAITQHSAKPYAGTLVLVVPSLRNAAEVLYA